MSKTCTKCSIEKPLEDFNRQAKGKYGRASQCRVCQKVEKAAWDNLNREHTREYSVEYQKNNPEAVKAAQDKYRKNNPDAVKASQANWRRNNPEASKASYTNWANRNKEAINAKTARRRAAKKGATPHWLTEVQLQEIKDFYSLARDCYLVTGEEYHVDHIIPLKGKDICGLHVPWNLQVLPRDINRKKNNKYDLNCTDLT